MKPVIFAGCDYLGMSIEKRLAKPMFEAAKRYGISPGDGRWSNCWSSLHQRLEDVLASFFDNQDACILGSAYLCGPAFFAALSDTYQVVFCDEYCHSNLLLGMRGAAYNIQTFKHLDANDLAHKLSNYSGSPPVVVTDGVFGMSGEVAPLREMQIAAEAHDALFLIDDAHGVFALGSGGHGSAEMCELKPSKSLVIMGSMSKALGVYGGFLTGAKSVIDKIRRVADYVGSTPPPIPIVSACIEALDIIKKEPGKRHIVEMVGQKMRLILSQLSIPLLSDTRVPIITMILKDRIEAEQIAEDLTRQRLLIKYFDYPSEPRKNLLRTAARSIYTEEHLDCFAAVMRQSRNR
jgi:7-keto-8-aminopelargonate synthetase-like enzyme